MRRLSGAFGDLVVDESVVEADRGRLVARVGVDDPGETRPIGGGEAHRAGLAARIEHRALEREGVDRAAGAADRDHLGMSGRVVRRGDLVPAFGEHSGRGGRSRPRTGRPRRPAMCSRDERDGAREMAAVFLGRELIRRPFDAPASRRLSAMRSRSARSWAATDAAITAGSLPRDAAARRSGRRARRMRSAAMPSARKRFSKRARFVFDADQPDEREPARRAPRP